VFASLARGSVSLLSGMVLRKAVMFAAVMVAVRVIPRDEYGVCVLFEAILALLLLLSDFGLVLSSTRLIAGGSSAEERRAAIGSAIVLRLATVGAFCLLLIPARALVHGIYHSALLDTLMAYMPVVLILACVNDLFTYILLGMHQHAPMAIAQVLSGVANLAGVIVFVWIERAGAVGWIWSLIISTAASLVFQYTAVASRIRIRFSLGTAKQLLRSGFPLQVNSFLTVAFTRLDTFLVGAFSGPGAVATYGVAMRIPDNLRYLFDSHRLVFFSSASKHFALNDLRGIQDALETSVRWLAFVFFGAAVMAVVAGDDIIRLFFSQQYSNAAAALPLLMIAMGLFLINCLFGSTLVAGARVGRVLYINLFTAAISAAANLILIPRLGFMGAAYTALLTHGVAAVAYIWSLGSLSLSVRFSCLPRSVAVFLVLATASALLPWHGLLVGIFYCAAYLAGCYLVGVVRNADVIYLRQAFARAGANA
jgi:O-antigen/teichoic acid export membrane protein